jgi:hypothetical protein
MGAPRETRYIGSRVPNHVGPGRVEVIDPDRRKRKLDPRLDLRRHSPDGFQWGYAGSGPSQLALALVADALADDEAAQRCYQPFKALTVAFWSDHWELTAGEIQDVCERMERRKAYG